MYIYILILYPQNYADDSTISEVVPMSNNVGWSDRNKLQLHPTKCKEFRIQFSKREYIAEPILDNN